MRRLPPGRRGRASRRIRGSTRRAAINPLWRSPILLGLAGVGWLVGHGVLPVLAAQGQAACFTESINDARAAAHAAPLSTDPLLTAVADTHAGMLAAAGRIFHNTALGSMVPSNWRSFGENVGMGSSCAVIAEAFLHSSEHRANILDPSFTEVGVGVTVGHDGTVYVTEDFLGTTSPAPAAVPAA